MPVSQDKYMLSLCSYDLQADDAVADVLGVRVHGRRHDPREMVREEVGRVEARVARSVRFPLGVGARSLPKGHRGYVLGHLRSSVNGRVVVR